MRGMRSAVVWTLVAIVSFAVALCPPVAHFADIFALVAVLALILGLISSLRGLASSSPRGRVGLAAIGCFQFGAVLFVTRVLMMAIR
jgi:hypothetical protein